MTTPYTTPAELARVLKIRNASGEQITAMERVLLVAAQEIDDEIDLAAGTTLTAAQIAVLEQVNLDRAADLWTHTEAQTGVTALLSDDVVASPGRYSWTRYAQRLANIKDQWGLA